MSEDATPVGGIRRFVTNWIGMIAFVLIAVIASAALTVLVGIPALVGILLEHGLWWNHMDKSLSQHWWYIQVAWFFLLGTALLAALKTNVESGP